MTGCPQGSKSYIDSRGNTLCCKGSVNGRSCDGNVFCSMSGPIGKIPTCSEVMRKYKLYGPWIGPTEIEVIRTAQLGNGETVYMIQQGQYTKMVSTNGQARYYIGSPNDFDLLKWNQYGDAGMNYRLRIYN